MGASGLLRKRLAVIADTLTALRAAVALPLFLTTAAPRYDVAASLLAFAWWTDFLDGRLARHAPTATRLGAWDPLVDAGVGLALLGGLVTAGVAGAVPWLLIGGVLIAWFAITGNLSAGMLLQALAYALFLAKVWINEPAWMGLLAATIGSILILDWRRFLRSVLPTFFAGVGLAPPADHPADAGPSQ